MSVWTVGEVLGQHHGVQILLPVQQVQRRDHDEDGSQELGLRHGERRVPKPRTLARQGQGTCSVFPSFPPPCHMPVIVPES